MNQPLTRAEIAAMTLPQLRVAVARFMESMPEPVTIGELRDSERYDWRCSYYYVYSPDGHWKADIGTSGDLSKGYYDRDWGNTIATWEPAPDYPSDIGAAMSALDTFDRKEWDIDMGSATEDRGQLWGVSLTKYASKPVGPISYGGGEHKELATAICIAILSARVSEAEKAAESEKE